jgi:hypothetical protein
MTCPSLPTGFFAGESIQSTAGIGLEIVHDLLGRNLRLRDDVHVIGPYMRSQEIPTTARTNLLKRLQHDRAAIAVQPIRRLIHLSKFRCNAPGIGLDGWASKQIVMPVYGTGFLAVEVCAVAGKSDEVPHFKLCPPPPPAP